MYCCARPKLEASVPRTVYGWFLGMHRVSVVIGMVGYAVLLIEVGPAFNVQTVDATLC